MQTRPQGAKGIKMTKREIFEANRTNAIIEGQIKRAKQQEKTLSKLARKILWSKPIKDWHPQDKVDLSVWQLHRALESAYMAGKNS